MKNLKLKIKLTIVTKEPNSISTTIQGMLPDEVKLPIFFNEPDASRDPLEEASRTASRTACRRASGRASRRASSNSQ